MTPVKLLFHPRVVLRLPAYYHKLGTYVKAVFTENYQPTVAQATMQPFFFGSSTFAIAVGWTISLKKSTNSSLGLLKHQRPLLPAAL